jgi:hypothetical protein
MESRVGLHQHVLMLLRDLGLDPASEPARRAVALVRDNVTWQGAGPEECEGNAFFDGEVEPCINGQVAAVGAYFGQDVRGIVERLLGQQLADGGWNCEAEKVQAAHHRSTKTLARLRTGRQRPGPEPGRRNQLRLTS